MITFTPFRPGHLRYVHPQKAQRGEHTVLLASGCLELMASEISLTGWDGSKCLGAAGLLPFTPWRATAWLILSEDAGPYMLPIARKVRRVVRASPYKRVEMTVNANFEEGQRFMELLGAHLDTPKPMKNYGAFGEAEYLYSIVKD